MEHHHYYDYEHNECIESGCFWIPGQPQFNSIEECAAKCVRQLEASRCHHTIEPGAGAYEIDAFGFDPITRGCYPFVYRGFEGNANRFEHKNECERECMTS